MATVDGYDFERPTRSTKLFTGIAVERPKSLDPNDRYGTEDIGAEDTFDGDYGRLLDRVFGKRGSVPNRNAQSVAGRFIRRNARPPARGVTKRKAISWSCGCSKASAVATRRRRR